MDKSLAHDFPTPSRDEWLALVSKVLKGADFDRRLVSRTADGLRIEPLYRRENAPATSASLPGEAPLVRGRSTAGARAGWDIRQGYAEPDPAAANAAILEDLAGGVTSIALTVEAPGQTGTSYEQAALSRALRGVMLDVCPVALKAGEYTPDAAGTLMAIWRGAGLAPGQWQGAFNYDPVANLARTGALYHPLGKVLEIAAGLARAALESPRLTALAADGTAWHNGGATEAQELAAVGATVVAVLKAGEKAGLAPAVLLPKMAVTLAVDDDQFLGIAKLRATRRIVWQIAEACGAGDTAASVPLVAETSWRMLAQRDPWVNMLRTTIACSAAAMGGADSITVLPFSTAIGRPDAFARRIARNTHHVLMEESSLGRVADPAGGSWYVEKLTSDLAAKAWTIFQSIEEKGGIGSALASGWWQREIAAAADARRKAIATARIELTGASAFPKLGGDGVTVEPWPAHVPSADLNGERVEPLVARRLAADYETLRDKADDFAKRTGKAPAVFLASLGPLAVHSARTTWIRNFLAAGGIEAIVSEGFTSSTAAGTAFSESGATVACLCSSDAVYEELAEATASLLKTAGAGRLYLAGRPKDQQELLIAAGVDEFIFAGCNAIDVLGGLQKALGVV